MQAERVKLGSARVERLLGRYRSRGRLRLCVEKKRLYTEVFRQTEGEPEILRRAKALAHYLDRRTIFIEEDELIVGNLASKPGGIEADAWGPSWPREELDELKERLLELSEEDEAVLRELDDYWRDRGRTIYERVGLLYDDERLWPFIRSGVLLPPWVDKREGRGHGRAGGGWGLPHFQILFVPDFRMVLERGLLELIAEAREELGALRYTSAHAVRKGYYLQAVIIALEAVVRHARRFSELAGQLAKAEIREERRRELQKIAEICERVPAYPASTFWEALQGYWFLWATLASGVAAGGRVDQLFGPYYERDAAQGQLTRDQALELLSCLRLKVAEAHYLGGNRAQRAKWAGLARWNNWVIGGVKTDGTDATNEVTYLVLDAVRQCPVPHPTITLRVHEGTPRPLLLEALDVVKLGLGMPAFVGDPAYIAYLARHGVPEETARDYALGGCLDAQIPGKSRTCAAGLFVVPKALELALNNGVDPRTGWQLGPRTGAPGELGRSFERVLDAFRTQLRALVSLAAEEHNILLEALKEMSPDPVASALMDDGIRAGCDILERRMPFENGSVLNPVGMINVVNALSALRRVVFEEKKVSLAELLEALRRNWGGYEEVRRECERGPRYGNGDEAADELARQLYGWWVEAVEACQSAYGDRMKPSGISITAYAPGGEVTGPTPDGRRAGENLVNGTLSAGDGDERDGITGLLRSAMKVDQVPFQSTLLNCKLHPTALARESDCDKLAALIKTYFRRGGKHIQFNVVTREMLLEAQRRPELYRDLVVRVAGYSAYFVQLPRRIQDDIIRRTEHTTV